MKLAELMLALFVGRLDLIAVQNGEGFAPEQGQITPQRVERDHLGGVKCLGFYLLDERSCCTCSCVDFDNKPERPNPFWREHAEQFYYAAIHLGLSPIVEISQSGTAAHVWMFLEGPTDAWVPRAFWRALAVRLGVKCPEIYPRQDRHVGKGVGNLVRYPLWNQSAFVDVEESWGVIDPVEALTGVRRVNATDLRLIAFQAGLGELAPEPRVDPSVIEHLADGAVPIRVAKLIEDSSTLIGKRWRNDSIGMADQSRSAVAMSLCCELVRAYVPTPEIGSALKAWLKLHDPDGKYDREKWLNDTVAKAYDYVTQKREVRSVSATTFRDAAHAYIDQIENGSRFYVPSGISELDASVDGIAPGEVCVLAGRPGHGKSAIAFQWLANAAKLGISGLIISEEMGYVEIGKRRLQSITSIPHEQWVAASASALRKDVDSYHKNGAEVYVVENCATIDRTEEIIDQFSSLYNVGLIAVDYLQLLGSRSKDRYEVVTEVSRRVKQAARRNNVPIILLSQLNREVEKRDDNEPKLSDLRESGQIEQDADLILFAQYPCKFDQKARPDLYRLVAAKRRNGPIRQPRMEITFNPHRQIIGGIGLPPGLLDL